MPISIESVDAKVAARQQVAGAIAEGGYGYRELVVRVNGLDTDWGADDVATFARLAVDALLFPKVESAAQVAGIVEAVDAAGGADVPVWLMIETPVGVLDVRAVANASERVGCLVMGTSDLVKELRARHTESRNNLAYALQQCVLVARAAGLDILDGVPGAVHAWRQRARARKSQISCLRHRDLRSRGRRIEPGRWTE